MTEDARQPLRLVQIAKALGVTVEDLSNASGQPDLAQECLALLHSFVAIPGHGDRKRVLDLAKELSR